MNIGDISKASGLPTKTIRYYEDIALVTPKRGDNGYRSFSETDLRRLQFLARARALGFSIDECRRLLALYDDAERSSAEVKALALEHLADIERKMADLQGMHDTLSTLIKGCAGDHRPDCPILEDLAGEMT
ncbi:Cu(I)-responsive transcriptional regulator [Cognatishimia maritima]|uniref:Cu(I)-responsive transcriptional regulator n=1 Tax=Cognatishimia maritima TaxID=870908 RepID=A0A1M5L508_9RHOB|nr:Cu(I)-responsive transcriptional regulator [Cognatishimia maritima]SHG59859.1 Cu(I)-responsive transcriptional regulator [Cognatishimia maritima]